MDAAFGPLLARDLEQTVRIQTDCGHQVTSEGPYRIVRHPMHAGTLVPFAGIAFLLGSGWSFVPAAAGAVCWWCTPRWRTGPCWPNSRLPRASLEDPLEAGPLRPVRGQAFITQRWLQQSFPCISVLVRIISILGLKAGALAKSEWHKRA